MNKKMKEAMAAAYEKLKAMPREEFIKEMNAHKDGVLMPEMFGPGPFSAGVSQPFTIGDCWKMEWIDEDYILITGPYKQKAKICGGDFESILSGLCSVEKAG